MNLTQQTDLVSTLIEQFIVNNIKSPRASELLEQWKSFPLKSSPHFTRIIHQACVVGNIHLVKYFKENYVHTLDQPNVRGETPLFIATKYNHLTIAKYLIENNVNVLVTTSAGDNYLHWLACLENSQLKG